MYIYVMQQNTEETRYVQSICQKMSHILCVSCIVNHDVTAKKDTAHVHLQISLLINGKTTQSSIVSFSIFTAKQPGSYL